MVLQLSLLLLGIWAVFLFPSLWARRNESALRTTSEYYNLTKQMDRLLAPMNSPVRPGVDWEQRSARREQILLRRWIVLGVLSMLVVAGVLAALIFRTWGIFLLGVPAHLALFAYIYALRRMRARRFSDEAFFGQPNPAYLQPIDVDSLESQVPARYSSSVKVVAYH